ncbi:MAG: hypothetical protein ABW096_09510 [Candidatus Thiodiazotropha sp.]
MKSNLLKFDSIDSILPILANRVFHVTPTTNIDAIRECGSLLPNTDQQWTSPYGNSKNGFFRLKNCVSFFDYRCYGTKEWSDNAFKCSPTQILDRFPSITFLFLNPNTYKMLISWEQWKIEQAWRQRVVPYVECGYPGPVPLSQITELLIIEES